MARHSGPDAEYIVPLYRMALSNSSIEKIADWMAASGMKFSNQMVKRTLRMAKREDLIEYLIQEEDISLGDTVKSRMTARVGEVVKIRPDGDTIHVKWETGGTQPLSKESVFKLRSKDIKSIKDISHVCTDKDDTYKAVEEKKLYERE